MRCIIEPMTLADYEEVFHLWQNSEGVGLGESDTRAEIAKFLRRNPGLSFIARQGSELIGALLCGHDGRRACLYHLAVAPAHRRNGLGTQLVRRSLAALKKSGISRCNVFFYTTNLTGKLFWQRLGWNQRPDLSLAQRKVGSPLTRRGC